MNNIGVILAAGKGSRMGARVEKQLFNIDGAPMICRSFDAIAEVCEIDFIYIVAPPENAKRYRNLIEKNCPQRDKLKDVIEGGGSRMESSYNALRRLKELYFDEDIVLIHDGARPFVKGDIVMNSLRQAQRRGSAIACVKPKDTIRTMSETLKRDELYLVQTPQTFKLGQIFQAVEMARSNDMMLTDEASAYERFIGAVSIIEGSYSNIKVTTKEDLPLDIRIGKGYDVHRLERGYKCILGGVEIESEKGLVAHSDGDVLLHSIMDSLLGAACLGDIGRHFPDTDAKYKGISSLQLLCKVGELIGENGFAVSNIDATLICETPKIAPHVDKMRRNISDCLKIDEDRINIKATTTERLGFTGRMEGVASEAVALVKKVG